MSSRNSTILFLLFFYLGILSILFEMPILRRFLDIEAALWYNVMCMIIYTYDRIKPEKLR